jgi:hypothetical protein
VVATDLGHRNGLLDSRASVTLDKSSGVCLLPHRQAWARRAPGIHNLVVGARVGAQPLEQIENQMIEGFRSTRAAS